MKEILLEIRRSNRVLSKSTRDFYYLWTCPIGFTGSIPVSSTKKSFDTKRKNISQLISNVPAFLLTSLLLAMVPGQGVAMVLRQSILGGRKAALFSVFGNSLGLFIWGTLSALGLSTIFAKSHLAYSLLKWTGVAFLVYLSIQTLITLKNKFGKFDLESRGENRPWPALRLGLFTNLTNVKAAVFAVAFLPQFVPANFSLGWGIFIFGAIWPLVSSSWYVFLIWTVDKSAIFIQKAEIRRALTAISAVGILVLAIGLAFSSAR